METFDYMIVGQGIAGSLLAWELLERGFEVLVIDDGYKSSSSKVAAGLMNPITGMRLVKSWEANKFLDLAKEYYINLEKRLNVNFFKEREILRIIKDDLELKQWEKRRKDKDYNRYLGERFNTGTWKGIQGDEFGSFIIKGGGYLDTKLFLNTLRKYFQERGVLCEEKFNYDAVKFEDERVDYQGIIVKKIIFCEGFKVSENPWFKNLRWNFVKGEILTIELKSDLPDKVINQGKWVMPVDKDIFRMGASYDWDHIDDVCSEDGKNEILEEIEKVIYLEGMNIVKQEAGVRPCTKDRMPYVGFHKDYKNLGILNGLGSKGAMMGPYYAIAMSDYLENGSGHEIGE